MIKKFSNISIGEDIKESDYRIHSDISNEFIEKNLTDYELSYGNLKHYYPLENIK